MILTSWINVRLGAIVLAAVLLQVTFFSYLSLFGTSPDFVVVVIAAIGLLGGAVVADSIVKGFLAFLLAYPTYPLIRRALRPALVLEEAPARRSTRTAPAARAAGRRRPGFLRGRKKAAQGRRTPSSRMRRSVAHEGGAP